MSEEITKNDVVRNDFWVRDNRGFLDKIQDKIVSRKFLVWITATVAFFTTTSLESGHWVAISLAYIGSEMVVDLATRWRLAGK